MAKPLRRPLDPASPCGYRSDGRPHDTGLIRPTRPCPPDFCERFIEFGWEEIEQHYRTNWRVIRRWIEEAGGEDLRQARAEFVRKHGCKRLHAAPLD